MAFPLLVVVLMATVSSVFANDYTFKIDCDGISYRTTRPCDVSGLGPHDYGYYKIELINDRSGSRGRCQSGDYELGGHNDKGVIWVSRNCHGYFGIKPKVTGKPYRGQCGQNNMDGFKIVRGYGAHRCQFPWMTYVQLDWKPGHYINCGGSIVDDDWILTAAHCLVKQHGDGKRPPPDGVFVRTGSLTKDANFIQREVQRVVVHRSYDTRYLANDIALLQLKNSIKWDGCHAPVCLNRNRNINVNLLCMVSGWGQEGANKKTTRELFFGYDKMMTRQECDRVYKSYSTDYTLCGRGPGTRHQGFCSGDSGGPLVCKESNSRFYQYGVVSLYLNTAPCAMEGLYTNVAAYYDWITSNIYG